MFEFLNGQLSTDQYLTHYWPITCGTMKDEIGSSHMTQGSLTSLFEDLVCDFLNIQRSSCF